MTALKFIKTLLPKVLFAAFLALAGCKATTPFPGSISQENFSALTGLKLGNIDHSVRPQDDLYRYASGIWLKGFELPEDRPSFGVFNSLVDEVQVSQRQYLSSLAAVDARELRTEERKLLDLYASYMNVELIADRGLAPLDDFLDQIARIHDYEGFAAYLGLLSSYQLNHPFFLFVEEDPADSSQFLFHLEQAGLGMPGRDFYLDEGTSAAETREKYRFYVASLFRLSGHDRPNEMAANVLRLEATLAKVQWALEETRDRDKVLNVYTIEDLQGLMPAFDWQAYFSALGQDTPDERIVIRQPSYFENLDKIFDSIPAEAWHDYLRFHLLNDMARFLPEAFVEARFNFFQGRLMDVNIMTPRHRRAFNLMNVVFRDVLAKAYVRGHTDPTIVPMVEAMAANLKAAFSLRLQNNTWMSVETKRNAQAKLDELTFRIGAPADWIDYSSLRIRDDDLIDNILNFNAFDFERQAEMISSGWPDGQWLSPPQTVNAFYNPAQNEIIVPLAFLQSPIFDPTVDMAANYGALGAIIGHEIIHAFDDQGRKYDEFGRYQNWWEEGDEAYFNGVAARLADRYSGFSPIAGSFINGPQTLGENIGDVEGLSLAFDAYRLTNIGGETRQMAGFSGEQRFFLAWAQLWVRAYQDAELRRQLVTSLHSPGEFRVNGAAQNIDGFYDAFSVVPGDALYLPPDERIRIW